MRLLSQHIAKNLLRAGYDNNRPTCRAVSVFRRKRKRFAVTKEQNMAVYAMCDPLYWDFCIGSCEPVDEDRVSPIPGRYMSIISIVDKSRSLSIKFDTNQSILIKVDHTIFCDYRL